MFIHTSSLPLWHMKMMDICGTNRRQLIFDFAQEGQGLSWQVGKPFTFESNPQEKLIFEVMVI